MHQLTVGTACLLLCLRSTNSSQEHLTWYFLVEDAFPGAPLICIRPLPAGLPILSIILTSSSWGFVTAGVAVSRFRPRRCAESKFLRLYSIKGDFFPLSTDPSCEAARPWDLLNVPVIKGLVRVMGGLGLTWRWGRFEQGSLDRGMESRWSWKWLNFSRINPKDSTALHNLTHD